jgi:hypothetical protein
VHAKDFEDFWNHFGPRPTRSSFTQAHFPAKPLIRKTYVISNR